MTYDIVSFLMKLSGWAYSYNISKKAKWRGLSSEFYESLWEFLWEGASGSMLNPDRKFRQVTGIIYWLYRSSHKRSSIKKVFLRIRWRLYFGKVIRCSTRWLWVAGVIQRNLFWAAVVRKSAIVAVIKHS